MTGQPQTYLHLDDVEMLRAYHAGNRSESVLNELRRRGLHAEIGEERPADWKAGAALPPSAPAPAPPFQFRPTPSELAGQKKDSDHRPILTTLGLLMAAGGFYFLFNPAAPDNDTIVNLQKLTMGESLMISGCVLFAAGMRPVRL
jgi:hypothetical protein